MKITIVFLFLIPLISCNHQNNIEDYLINTWQTSYLKIEYQTYNLSDSTYVFEDKFDNNPEIIAQSQYFKNGTFDAWFVDKNNSIQNKTTGKWFVKKDTLFVDYFYNGKDTKVGYHILKTKNGFVAKSIYDWDNDGEFDDTLTMQTKKMIPTN